MPSATYNIFREAILGEKQITCTYNDEQRGICAIILGHTDGEEKALTYQFEGASGRGWRCLYLSRVTNAQLRDGPWHEGSAQHIKTQTCVVGVDLDINIHVRKRRQP
jgi:hypothetical protein